MKVKKMFLGVMAALLLTTAPAPALAAGGNQMIDASSSEGKIRITNIYSVAYWKNHFIKGCRIF